MEQDNGNQGATSWVKNASFVSCYQLEPKNILPYFQLQNFIIALYYNI